MFRSISSTVSRNIVCKEAKKLECTKFYSSKPRNQGSSDSTLFNKILRIKPSGYVTLIFPVTTLALGVWQIKRSFWKANIIEEMEAKLRKKPVPLPHTMEEISKLAYAPVKVKGHFDHSREIILGPRTFIDNKKRYSSALISDGSKAGFFVFTPFKPDDRDYYILVNRGWVPVSKKKPEDRKEGQIEGEVELTGLVRLTEKRPQFVRPNEPERNNWVYRDLEAMGAVAGTAPISIDATAETTVPGGPIGGQTLINTLNSHNNYAITWISLSLLSGIIWWQTYFPK